MSNYDPTDIRSQERTKADTDLRNKLAKDTEEADLKWLMGSKQGRRIVRRRYERASPMDCSFNTNSMTMAFVEGRAAEARREAKIALDTCPELFVLMLKEAEDDNRNLDDGSRNDH